MGTKQSLQLNEIEFQEENLIIPLENTTVSCPLEQLERVRTQQTWDGVEAKTIVTRRNWETIEIVESTTVELELGNEKYIASYQTPDQLK